MKKSEMFDILVDKVSEICEVSRKSMVDHVKLQAVVDGRILAVQYLKRIGLSSDDIALIVMREKAGDPGLCPQISELKKHSRAVDKMFNSYSQRCLESYAFCLMSEEIREFVHNRYKEMYLSWMKPLPPK